MKAIRLGGALVVAAIVLMQGVASAQVATTDLVPGGMRLIHPFGLGINSAGYTPDNPAANAWGSTLIGGGIVQGEQAQEFPNPAIGNFDLDGNFGGLRIVGGMFALAGETYAVDSSSTVSGQSFTPDQGSNVQISVAFGEWLSIGAGTGSHESEADPTGLGPGAGQDVSRQEAGISLRLGDSIYVGAAKYSDESEISALGQTFERDGMLAGIALRTEGNVRWYLAYDLIDLDNFDFTAIGGGPSGGLEMTAATVQVRGDWIVLGATVADLTASDTTTETIVDYTRVDLGYAPATGLSITLSAQSTDVTGGGGGGGPETVDSASVAIAWQF